MKILSLPISKNPIKNKFGLQLDKRFLKNLALNDALFLDKDDKLIDYYLKIRIVNILKYESKFLYVGKDTIGKYLYLTEQNNNNCFFDTKKIIKKSLDEFNLQIKKIDMFGYCRNFEENDILNIIFITELKNNNGFDIIDLEYMYDNYKNYDILSKNLISYFIEKKDKEFL